MPSQAIYLDHAATTPVRDEVLEVMQQFFAEIYGNPSSIHRAGRQASVLLERSRETLAALLNARPGEIIFTSGGTESDNAAVRGIALARRASTGANRLIVSAVEHKAVLETAEDLRDRFGFQLDILPVDGEGQVSIDDVASALGDGRNVALVSVMYANNEIGTIEPIAEIGSLCRSLGVPFHTDAVQAGGKLPLDVEALQVDALSLGAHKFYGPKGVGLLYLRSGTPFWPQMTGGGQERGRRAGTENVPLIAAMAKALELAEQERVEEEKRLRDLRDHLIGALLESIEGVRLTGAREKRLPNHVSIVVEGAEAEGMLIALDLAGIAASSGSACASGAHRPSHVLEAIGLPPHLAAGALRFSLGRSTTADDIDYLQKILPKIVQRVRT
ncbi:cysteine desulfurase family protein [Caldilinea aerophila]|uniref:cysteine desulfurase n=1 Tax=Caldilinea aerophila (strain DSM 14535 / JCM 11387 / NBRC 104270 / STL-6-O1) TaxID=926550 RepID=I0I4X9_CALAS|nr:cysteine desulfurase family protein [Caldilinea aerophila]BAM00317.1 cysteine desulfurase [Caldilinea aerophila DSM 14535 = NBRC 104270]